MKFFSHGILGMNARNLLYIQAKNSSESTSLADSKLKTKHFLSSRGIPFAETYTTITSPKDLKGFSFSSVKSDAFVIKPNKGSGGKGILIVRKVDSEYLIQGESWTEEELKLHMIDILHGSFSLHGSSDVVILEELLTPGIDFDRYCTYGLADIRIIVYNYIPITAMIRMPTIHSGGKANLAQGGIGLGLNIANGQVMSLFENKRIHTHTFPPGFELLKGQTLPFWDDILLYSSQVQMYTKLGYLALDWVITKNGPRLLEINARAGLEIQNVNLVPLAARLKKIEDLKILSPHKGVEIAKTLFHTETLYSEVGKKIIYLEQKGMIDGKEITIRVDTTQSKTRISGDIMDVSHDKIYTITTDTDLSIPLEVYEFDDSLTREIVLGTESIKEYLIQPTIHKQVVGFGTKKWTDELLSFDEEVYKISKKINLSSLLRPDNYFTILDEYIKKPGNFNPFFEYHFPTNEKIFTIRETLKQLQERAQSEKKRGLLLADLYIEKLYECEIKADLLESYKDENFEKIAYNNTRLFGKTDESLLQLAKEKVFSSQQLREKDESILGKVLSLDEIIIAIHSYFESHKISKIPITIESGNLSRMSVSYGKSVKIHISKYAVIREKEIRSILSHEIGTHFRRYLNGRETGLKLFQFGTGFYLSDEEGFAIYRSFSNLPDGYQKNAMYLKYYLLSVTDTLSFSETLDLLRTLYPDKTSESIFSDAVRLKRGITHAGTRSTPGTTYQKDKIYLDGYMRVKDWLDSGGNEGKLFYGKIKIQDLKILELL
ncbi:DUF1704 domain-containing protein [Candidatus Gracilibacteria bacterium]|nr:DUF1704 domain-containing protein [Candidatus Gracilibacteria bacterium]